MILDTLNRRLQVILTTAMTTNNMPVTVTFVDKVGAAEIEGTQLSNTNGTIAALICDWTTSPPPTGNVKRKITGVTVYNADTVSKTVQIRIIDGVTTYMQTSATLVAGDSLVYK